MNDTTIAFIGLGLIGGSLAKGIKRARPDIRIMAYMRTRSKLEQAKKDGIVDVILDGIDEQLKECDLIFLCTPVEYNAQYLSKIRSYLKPGALITDVGSTKTDIHEEILRQGLTDCFVGGHPMAGSEKTGYENATDHLLENAYYIVTPPEGLDQSGSETGNIPPKYAENANRIIAVAQTVGAIPLVLDYREHDKVVAAISHLPHLVASSLVNLVKDADSPAAANYYFDEEGIMKTGKQTIYDEDLGETQNWLFHAEGSKKGQGYHGIKDNTLYVNGLRQEADKDLRFAPVSLDDTRYLVNVNGAVQKAGSTSKSASRPELGSGYKDFKDENDMIWTVNTEGIIQ